MMMMGGEEEEEEEAEAETGRDEEVRRGGQEGVGDAGQ